MKNGTHTHTHIKKKKCFCLSLKMYPLSAFRSFCLSVCLSLYGATFLFGVDVALSYLPLCRKFKSFLFEMKWDGEEERERERERDTERILKTSSLSHIHSLSAVDEFSTPFHLPPLLKKIIIIFFFFFKSWMITDFRA